LCFFLFFIPALLNSPSLFTYPYSYPLHFPSFFCATIHCSPSQLFFLTLLIYSFPCLQVPLLSSPNLSPHYYSLLNTHHPLTSLQYQLYTILVPCNPWHKHPSLQQQKYTQTHTRATKTSNPHNYTPIHWPFSLPPAFWCHLY
jgi:hypothetical protein